MCDKVSETYLEKLNNIFKLIQPHGGKIEYSDNLIVTLAVENVSHTKTQIRLTLSKMIDGNEHDESYITVYVELTDDRKEIYHAQPLVHKEETPEGDIIIDVDHGIFGPGSAYKASCFGDLPGTTEVKEIAKKFENMLDRIAEDEYYTKPRRITKFTKDEYLFDREAFDFFDA